MATRMLRLLAFACLAPWFWGTRSVHAQARYQVLPDSKLQVQGRTNVGRYRCDVQDYPGTDTLFIRQSIGQWTIEQGGIHVLVRTFSCHNPFMTADFRRTVNAEAHPMLIVRIHQLVWPPVQLPIPPNSTPTAQMTVRLAGVKQSVRPTVQVRQQGKDLWLRGQQPFTFQQFGLIPPHRLLNTVVVQDSLTVHFDLHLRRLD